MNKARSSLRPIAEDKSSSVINPLHRPATIHAKAQGAQHHHLSPEAPDNAHDDIGDFEQVDTDDVDDSDDPNAAGRISEASLERIKDGLLQVQKLAQGIATMTGLSTSQIFDRWMATSQRTHVKRNRWNLYSAYFKDNEEQERARLSEREFDMHYSHPCHKLI